MKTATISYTKNNLSALLDQVRHGETITILDRDKPVARIVPIESAAGVEWDERLDELERMGLVRRGSGKSAGLILREPPPKPQKGASGLTYLLQERESGP